MADHRAEQIMDAFTTTVTGLTTTGTNVVRDRPYDVDLTDYALSVYQGDEIDYEEQNVAFYDVTLSIEIQIHAKISSSTPISQQLNLIRKEIYIALMADTSLGLSFARHLRPLAAEKPNIEAGDKPTALQLYTWAIDYRHSYTDPSA